MCETSERGRERERVNIFHVRQIFPTLHTTNAVSQVIAHIITQQLYTLFVFQHFVCDASGNGYRLRMISAFILRNGKMDWTDKLFYTHRDDCLTTDQKHRAT